MEILGTNGFKEQVQKNYLKDLKKKLKKNIYNIIKNQMRKCGDTFMKVVQNFIK